MAPTDVPWHEYAGHIHLHTVHSDGSATFDEVVRAAEVAGLDFVVTTDHNVLLLEQEGQRSSVLVLVGQEVHDEALEPEGNHLLVLGVTQDVTPHRRKAQQIIDAVANQNGLSFLAHPIEHGSRYFPKEYSWSDWDATGYDGIELWNFMSECKAHISSKPTGLLLSLLPQISVRGPWPEVLALWDRLSVSRPVVAVGGSDNHGGEYRIGFLTRHVFAYSLAFRTVNTHIITPTPFNGVPAHDRGLIYSALRAGHCWVGYDLLGPTVGFRFRGVCADRTIVMGDTLAASPQVEVELEACVPHRARLRLLRDGRPVAEAWGDRLRYVASEPGVYRLEAQRWRWGRWRGWIFSNPIYLRHQTS